MKKFILSFGLVSLLALNAFQLTGTVEKSVKVKPNINVINLSVQSKDVSLEKIMKKVLKVRKIFRFCSQFDYNVLPIFEKNSFRYYLANMNIVCRFKNAKKIDSMISKTDTLVNTKLWINSISQQIKNIDKVKNSLRVKAYNKAFLNVQKLSQDFNKTCFITSLNFDQMPYPIYKRDRSPRFFMAKSVSIALPKNEKAEEVKVKARYTITCY